MNKIKTYQDLQELKKHLESELTVKMTLIRKDGAELREEWKPVTTLLSRAGKFTTRGNANPFMAIGIDLLGEVFVRNILLARSGWIVQMVVPFLTKNFSSLLLNKDGTSVLGQMLNRFRNQKSNGQQVIENE